ncbi:MAG: alpha-L-rhamnosidase N-terminal domain-containing protein, partial [Clostridia bacterium]|nr:alpha-L-rhamnosidase N-terminal domain-containing protein [Clostridia bacterium]
MHTSKWITCPGAQYSETKLYWFRRTLTLPSVPEKAVLHISAEARYKLFVNGERVCFGPCRTSAEEKYYDTIDIAPWLKEGENELFCAVLQLSEPSDMTASRVLFAIRRTGNLALAAKLTCTFADGTESVIITDENWDVCPSPASAFPLRRPDMIVCTLEETFAEGAPDWQKASVLARVDCAREKPFLYGITNDLFLTPRPIPMLYQTDVTPRDADGKAVLPDEDGYIIMDEMTFGFPRFVFTGTGTVTIRYAESFGDGAAKGDRLDRSLGITGCTDVVSVDGETVFEPFWFRTCRIIRVEAEGDVTLADYSFTETGYPLEVPADCNFGSDTDNALWKISVATLKRCMIESYEDCPFYEQLQYDMDTSMQMIFNYQLTNDDRLARKAIHDFRLSQRADGLMNSRYPSTEIQYIPTFCFYYIFMLAEHYKRFGDKALIRENLRAMDGVLEWFDGYVEDCGLLRNTMYWDFVDWSAPWMATRG